jgi:uncharacterized damage-inducible protein DinB
MQTFLENKRLSLWDGRNYFVMGCQRRQEVSMKSFQSGLWVAILLAAMAGAVVCGAETNGSAAREYEKHFAPLGQLSVLVAEAMPQEKYGFKPHPESMSFGELMVHIATTNYQFCAGLKDADAPTLPKPADKSGITKFLGDSFQYCSGVIGGLTETQLAAAHNSPDGHLPGREVLLAMYIHVAHHRGQAEIYLRDNGIKPPGYRI